MSSRLDSLFASQRITYRALGFILALGLCLTAWVEPVDIPRSVWNWAALLGCVGLSLVLGFISFAQRISNENLLTVWGAVLAVGIVYEATHIYDQNLSYLTSLPLFLNLAAASSTLREIKHLRIFIIVAAFSFCSIALSLPEPIVPTDFFLMGMICYSGFIYLLFSSSISIRKRKDEVEKRLRHSEELLEQAQGIALIGGWKYKIGSDLQWTRSLWELLELDPPEGNSQGASFSMLAAGCQRILQANINDLLAGSKSEFELNTNLLSGKQRRLDVRILGQASSEYPDVVVGTVQDVTAQVAQSKALKQAHEVAENAARARSQFLANMSHEIRTPLNGVIGMTSLLSETNLDGTQKEFTDIILSSGEVLLSIINEILDFSKIDAGEFQLESLPFDLEQCLSDSINVVRQAILSKGLNLVFEWDLELARSYLGDNTRLRQIVINLLSNAVKFTDAGEIRVLVKAGEMKAEGKQEIRLSVIDSGIGIPKDRLNSIFNPFAQEDATTARRFGGTGLGLAISRDLLQLMGGDIEVKSKQGQGSEFKIRLPLEISQANSLDKAGILLKKSALVAVSDTNNQQVIANTCSKLGMTYKLFSKVEDVHGQSVLIEKFDVLIFDRQQSKTEVHELIRKACDAQPGAPKLIQLSSLGENELEKAGEVLVKVILTKPLRARVLVDNLLALFDDSLESVLNPNERTEIGPRFTLKTLVAEDNLINQKVAVGLLNNLGINPDIVENGQEAINQLALEHYDLVFMDVQMPVLDGIEATRKIREDQSIRQPQIVAMTANSMIEDRNACLQAGMNDFLSKPVRPGALIEILERTSSRMQ